MSADYNGWADRPEEEREAEEAAEEAYAVRVVTAQWAGRSRSQWSNAVKS